VQSALPGFASPVKGTPSEASGVPFGHDVSATADALDTSGAHDALAHEIGREHARHGLVPPLPHLLPGHPVREGWQAGRRAFAGRRSPATPALRLALKLRLQAWAAGRAVETLEVNPRYLQQLDTAHCAVTREPLVGALDQKGEVVGLNRSAAWAGGHLALLGHCAARALAALPLAASQDDWRRAADCGERAAETKQAFPAGGLSADQWARMATLLSFVTPLPHDTAARLPLRTLPPARLRLLNPIQGLQALITLQLLHADWQPRMAQLAEQVARANPSALKHFHIVFHTLLARALEGGRPADEQALRERLEDAWAQPHLLRRWQTFALALSPAQAAALERQAALIGQGRRRVKHHPSAGEAMEGWHAASVTP
jgi:hypothetical protein